MGGPAAEGRRRNTLASAKMGVAVEGRRRNLLASARMEVNPLPASARWERVGRSCLKAALARAKMGGPYAEVRRRSILARAKMDAEVEERPRNRLARARMAVNPTPSEGRDGVG